jgi:hypothetical protein
MPKNKDEGRVGEGIRLGASIGLGLGIPALTWFGLTHRGFELEYNQDFIKKNVGIGDFMGCSTTPDSGGRVKWECQKEGGIEDVAVCTKFQAQMDQDSKTRMDQDHPWLFGTMIASWPACIVVGGLVGAAIGIQSPNTQDPTQNGLEIKVEQSSEQVDTAQYSKGSPRLFTLPSPAKPSQPEVGKSEYINTLVNSPRPN